MNMQELPKREIAMMCLKDIIPDTMLQLMMIAAVTNKLQRVKADGQSFSALYDESFESLTRFKKSVKLFGKKLQKIIKVFVKWRDMDIGVFLLLLVRILKS